LQKNAIPQERKSSVFLIKGAQSGGRRQTVPGISDPPVGLFNTLFPALRSPLGNRRPRPGSPKQVSRRPPQRVSPRLKIPLVLARGLPQPHSGCHRQFARAASHPCRPRPLLRVSPRACARAQLCCLRPRQRFSRRPCPRISHRACARAASQLCPLPQPLPLNTRQNSKKRFYETNRNPPRPNRFKHNLPNLPVPPRAEGAAGRRSRRGASTRRRRSVRSAAWPVSDLSPVQKSAKLSSHARSSSAVPVRCNTTPPCSVVSLLCKPAGLSRSFGFPQTRGGGARPRPGVVSAAGVRRIPGLDPEGVEYDGGR